MTKHRTAIIILGLVILTVAAYWQVLGNGFVDYDDDEYVYANKNLQQGITLQGLKWAFNVGYAGNWHPVTWMSHLVDYRLFGTEPMGHHAVNLLFHILNAILLLLVLSRMTGSVWRSAFVAALFAVHPLHVESVAWISERKDVLSAFFWLLTMGAYVLYSEKPSVKRYLPMLVLYALGLMAKPMLVTLPFVLILLDYWPLGRLGKGKNSVRRLILEKLPLFALAVGSSVLTMIAQRRGEAVADFGDLSLGVRIANAVVSYAAYMYKMFWPAKLAFFYPHPTESLSTGTVALAVLLLAGISVLVLRFARSRPYLAFGWLWYLVTLLPVIGVVQVGKQAMADRYTYVPLIGLFVMIAWGIPRLRRGWEAVGAGAALVVGVFAACAWIQVGYWHDSVALFRHAIDVTEGNYLAEMNLGFVLGKQGKLDEAVERLNEALLIRPDWDRAYYNLGVVLAKQGDVEGAIGAYQEVLRVNPSFSAARANLVNLLVQAGRTDEALAIGQADSGTGAGAAELHFNMGCTLEQQGKLDDALKEYQEAIRLKPDFGLAHNNLAVNYFFRGDYAKAWEEVHLAQQCQTTVNPGFLQALAEKMPDPGG